MGDARLAVSLQASMEEQGSILQVRLERTLSSDCDRRWEERHDCIWTLRNTELLEEEESDVQLLDRDPKLPNSLNNRRCTEEELSPRIPNPLLLLSNVHKKDDREEHLGQASWIYFPGRAFVFFRIT